jgi:hypothetical protein
LNRIDGGRFQQDPEGLQQCIQTISGKPFDLKSDYMLRASLVTLDECDHLLIVTLHHIAADAWSTSVLVKELAELYIAYEEGRPAILETLEIQYADFAMWQRHYLQGNVLDAKLDYWKTKLVALLLCSYPQILPDLLCRVKRE